MTTSLLTPGLVSITFRPLAPAEILALMTQAGLTAVEWGGDFHVPHGELVRAAEVARMTADVGIGCCAYGSYYRVGESESEGLPFAQVLETAVALGAPSMRVWAGRRGSADADPAYRSAVIDDAVRIADLAAAAGVAVALEYHGGTLTDTDASARQLARELPHANLWFYWQPPVGLPPADCLMSLQALLPRLLNLHVFHWQRGHARRPLAEGAEVWRTYLEALAATGRPHCTLLEFVKDDSPMQLLADAAALRELTGHVRVTTI
jgi:3-dehydroshikimate dehydratase